MMRIKRVIGTAALLVLAACNENDTNTELPTEAGETVSTIPADGAVVVPGDTAMEGNTPEAGQAPEPIPESLEADVTE